MDIPQIEQVKIQAKVLVPLIKTLRDELGEEHANAILRKTLGNFYRAAGERWWRRQQGSHLGEKMAAIFDWFAGGDALDYEVVNATANAFDVNVTRCRYANFFHEIGEPELGFLLICSADFPMCEGFGDGVKLTRTQTIMEGASHCDFRYAMKE
jgi:L-2-amino-thiazoline-4-carboxylic acid hydrolase